MTTLFILLMMTSMTYADISKVQPYPSEITVTFDALEVIEIPEKISRKERRKYESIKPEVISYQRFIRIINSLDLKSGEEVSLNFYDIDDKLISKNIITNTTEPTPKYIFFMDRDSGRNFKGFLDTYHIPSNAHYFQIVANNKVVTHPDFEKKDKVLISQYQISKDSRKLMVQVELLGTSSNILARLGIFYFPRLR